MGKKIQYDQALKMASIAPCDSIFAKDNPYGYKINVNHPKILPLYQRYKDKIGERILSDQQRRHFELLIFELMTFKEHSALHMKERHEKRRNDLSTK